MAYAVVETGFGFIGVCASAKGLRRMTLPQPSPEAAFAILQMPSGQRQGEPEELGDLPQRLERYFSGDEASFRDVLDLSGATPFARAVYEATRSIPLGETRSYSWVAERIGRPQAARAVGQAMAANPICIVVPCHRVIGRDGRLCGFGGGLEMKRRLLDLEARIAGGAR